MKTPKLVKWLLGFGGSALLTLSPSIAQDVGDIELIAYWDFENTTEDAWNGYAGWLGGNATYTDGEKFGMALDTSALEGSFFKIEAAPEDEAHPAVPEFFDNFHATASERDQVSYTFWQKNLDAIRDACAFWNVSETAGGSQRGAQAHTPWSNDNIYFDTAGCCDASTQRINSPSGVEDWETWNHFAFIKNGSTKQIWVNGELLLEGENTEPLPADMISLYIGNGIEENRDIPGLIDEFAVIAGAMSEDQVKELAGGATVIDLFDPSDPNFAIGKSVNFGQLPAINGPQEVKFSFKNTGDTKALNISSAMIVSGDTGNFSLVSSPTTVASEQKGEVVLSFDSKGEFRAFEAVLEFKTDDPDAEDQTVLVPVRARVLNPVGPAAHYTLDEASGTVAADLTGSNRNGTYAGATLGVAGLKPETGKAASFSGGTHVAVPGGSFPPLTNFSIALWVNGASSGDAGVADFRTLVGKGDDSPAFALLEANGELLWFKDTDVAFATSSAPITPGTTYHIVMRQDGTAGQASIFVDGQEVASSPLEPSDEGDFYIGGFAGALGFDGTIDDVQVYPMAITNEQIAFLMGNPGQVLKPDGPVDTDNDGLSDQDELNVHGTDPFDADSDKDTLSDGQEIALGTNPNNRDSDGDGFSDSFEITENSDPTSANSIPGDPFGQPSEVWTVLEALPTFDAFRGGDDGKDATFRVFIDFSPTDATADEREMIFETGGGTIGISLVYEIGNKLVLRAAGNGGNTVSTIEYELTPAQLAAGELSVVWTFDVDNGDAATGQTVSLYIDDELVGQDSQDLDPDWSGGNAAAFGVASPTFAAGGGNTSLTNGVDFRSGTINLEKGLQFFADKVFVPTVKTNTILILGTGTATLLGSDLTDPDNNGLDALGGATDPSWNWVAITANIEADFEGGENAFNIFDNKVGGGNDKWCCDDPTPDNPYWVSVEFANAVSLTHFTITNGNDTPDRDPTNWAIEGSNDGVNFETIFAETEKSIWSETRNEVALVTLGEPSKPYKHLRYIVFDTPGTLHQLNEIEYFGNVAGTKSLLVNGSFEEPVLQNINTNNLGTVPTGWSQTGDPATWNLIRNDGSAYGSGVDNAADGSQIIDLNGIFELFQNFTLAEASTVTFGASFANREGHDGSAPSTVGIYDASGTQLLSPLVSVDTSADPTPSEVWRSGEASASLPAGEYQIRIALNNFNNVDAVFANAVSGGGTDPRPGLGVVASSTGPLTESALVDFGALSGDATYEFSFNAVNPGASTAMAGNDVWGLKLDQWNQQGIFGTTQFGVADNLFEGPNVASVFGSDVHVVIVNDTAAGETRLYIDGALAGSWAGNFELAGEGRVMGAKIASAVDPMGQDSIMYGWATYDTALAPGDIVKLATAPFAGGGGGGGEGGGSDRPTIIGTVIAGPSSLGLSFTGAAGKTYAIEYSQDLKTWTSVATGLSGNVNYEDTDATRQGRAEGYYRAVEE